MPPRLAAIFGLDADGTVHGNLSTAGGQTELMARLLMPLPQKAIAAGRTEEIEFGQAPAGGRFAMSGVRKLTLQKIENAGGRRLAHIRAVVEMKGDREPAEHSPPGRVDGSMTLKAETNGVFDMDGGYYREATTQLWFKLVTARMEQGVKKTVELEQNETTTVKLTRDPQGAAGAGAGAKVEDAG